MTTHQEALLPCPFCGSDESMLFCDPDHDNSGPSRRIQCAGCNIEAPFYPTEAEAIAAWNRRAPTLAPADNGLVERYSMSIQDPFDRDPPGLEPDNDGDWVTYSDYKALLSDRTAQAARLSALEALLDKAGDLVVEWRRRIHAIGRDVGSYRQCADELNATLTAIKEARRAGN